MLQWRRIHPELSEWNRLLANFEDRTLFQSSAWLEFLQQSVGGELVFAALNDGSRECGYFVGMVISKLGLRILGSPLPGWTTSYMGMVLQPGVARLHAFEELIKFAFRDLRCVHLELMDRHLPSPGKPQNSKVREYKGYEIDLSLEEQSLWANFNRGCRGCVRKASRCGVTVEEASDLSFAEDYYRQLTDVFAKQNLSPTYSMERVKALIEHLQPTGQLLLLRALDRDRQCIATGIFPAMNDRAYFWGGASWREHQHLRPNELIIWYALRYWKRRGIRYFDFSGAGEYKRKYGCYEINVPWIRTSRYSILGTLRDGVETLVKLRQRVRGWAQRIPSAPQDALAEPTACETF